MDVACSVCDNYCQGSCTPSNTAQVTLCRWCGRAFSTSHFVIMRLNSSMMTCARSREDAVNVHEPFVVITMTRP